MKDIQTWYPRTGVEVRRSRTDRDPTPTPTTIRFPGDPGQGKFYFGGRADTLTSANPPGFTPEETAISTWESKMATWSGGKQLGIMRIYGAGSTTVGFTLGNGSDATRHLSHGRLPHVSFKFPSGGAWGTTLGTQMNTAIAFGADWETWMDALANQFKSLAPNPIWWTFFHEPEDFTDSYGTTGAANYRLICRNMVFALRTRGVTNATYVNGCIQAPFDYGQHGGTRDWRWYYADWKGTSTGGSTAAAPNAADFYLTGTDSVVDIQGVDVYSWWTAAMYAGQESAGAAATAGEALSNYESFQSLWQSIQDRNDFLGKPYCIAEYGIEAYHTGTYIPPGVTNVATVNGTLSAPGDAVFAGTNDQITKDNLAGMFAILGTRNIVGLEVYNYMLSHNPWRLEYGDPNGARYEGYGRGVGRDDCVRPALGA